MALSFRACPGRLELPPSCCTLDCSDHSSSPVHGVAMHSDSQTPERSWAFFLRSIGYHPVTGIVSLQRAEPAIVTGNAMVSYHGGHRNLFTLLCEV